MRMDCTGCAVAPGTAARTRPCHGVDEARREFLAQAFLAALGAVVMTACGDGQIGGPFGPDAQPLPEPLVITVGDFAALAAIGGTARVDAATTRPVAVTRTGAQTFVALSMICPHQSFKPIDITSVGFRCPNHGARFDRVGNHTGGQRTTALNRYTAIFDVATDGLTII